MEMGKSNMINNWAPSISLRNMGHLVMAETPTPTHPHGLLDAKSVTWCNRLPTFLGSCINQEGVLGFDFFLRLALPCVLVTWCVTWTGVLGPYQPHTWHQHDLVVVSCSFCLCLLAVLCWGLCFCSYRAHWAALWWYQYPAVILR